MRVAIASAFAAALLIGGPSQAQKTTSAPSAPPASVTEMMACRAMTDSAARLACYDRAVGNLQQAVAARDVVIISAADVRKTRRSLFGFTVPKLPFFGGNDDTPEAKEIVTKVAGARSLGYGKWQIRLEDGAMWETTEGFREGDIPGVGDSIRITKGALGNYFMSVSGSKSVRARRLS
jgi:hypothetical protein